MKNQQHIIKNQIFEIQVLAEMDSYKFKDKISYLLQKHVYPKLGVICDKHSKYDTHYNITRLELDLGRVDLSQISSVLINQIPQKFEVALLNSLKKSQKNKTSTRSLENDTPHNKTTRYLNISENENYPEQSFGVLCPHEIKTQNRFKKSFNQLQTKPLQNTSYTTLLQTIVYFLNTGTLPWCSKDKKKSLASMLTELATTDLDSTKQLLSSLNKNAWKRLIIQQNDYQLLLLLKILSPRYSRNRNTLQLHQNLYKQAYFSKIASSMSTDQIRLHYWSFIFTFTLISSNNEIGNNQAWFQLLIEVISKIENFSVLPLSHKEKLLIEKIFKKFTISPNIISKNYTVLLKVLSKYIDFFQEHRNNLDCFSLNNKLKAFRHDLIKLKNIVQQSSLQFSSHLANLNPIPSLLDDTYYIENSGLVLYWVYLKDFFTKLGFLNKKQNEFINDTASIRAALLLNLLVEDSAKNIIEDELTLNKILCGLSINTPIPNTIKTNSFEREECNFLAFTLMRHWKAIGTITLKDFCQAFVKRPGTLRQQNNQWILRVEKKPHDILLNKLTWSINVIKLPWMQYPIIVEW